MLKDRLNLVLAAGMVTALTACSQPETQTPTIFPTATSTAKPFSEVTPTNTADVVSKDEIERKYNVKVVSVSDFSDLPDRYHQNNVPQEWDTRRLQMLDRALSLLPEYFYSPDSKGKRLIALGVSSTLSPFSNFELDGYTTIELEYDMFRSDAPDLGFGVIAHEFIHTVDPEVDKTITIHNPDGTDEEKLVQTSIWYDKVDEIMGESFDHFAPRIRAKVEEKMVLFVNNGQGYVKNPNISPFPQYEMGGDWFYVFMFNALGSPDEFVAYLGQYYTLGRQDFLKYYSQIYGEDKANKLYDFAKEDIFKGKEYGK